MLLKFFEREKGGLTYVLRDRTATVLVGDPNLTKGLIESISGRQRYTAGVLSEIENLPLKIRAAAIFGANYQLCAGLPEDSLSIAWIGHSGKGRNESHLVAANMELITGHAYSPYIDRIDRHRIQAWQERFNLMHSLPDPLSRLRVRPDYTKSRLPAEHQKTLMVLWNQVHESVESGLVTSRAELVAYLCSVGWNIRAESYKGKSLEQPVLTLSDGSILRLKGSCYYRIDFTPAMLSPKLEKVRPEVTRARINELRGIVARGLEFRAHHTIGRLFGRTEQRRVEPGGARRYLAQLLQVKLVEWEVSEPIHPMFGPAGIAHLSTLIELTNSGVKIPVLDGTTGSEPISLQERTALKNIPVSTADKTSRVGTREQPSPCANAELIPPTVSARGSAQAISTANCTEGKESAPEATLASSTDSVFAPNRKRGAKGRKMLKHEAPATPGGFA